jgi:membrane associated rhomboid family serine protease
LGEATVHSAPKSSVVVAHWVFNMVLPLGDLHRTQIVPYITYGLIALNVAVFLVQQQKGDEFTLAYAATPYEISHDVDLDQPVVTTMTVKVRDPLGRGVRLEERPVARPHVPCPIPVRLTLLTSMFLHGSWMHLIGNMLYLWIVGDNVEEVLGSLRYFIVYFTCGLAGSLAQIAIDPDSITPTLGASGAIAGLMGCYVIWFPHNQIRVLLFRFITVLPAIIVIGGWIVLQIWLGASALGGKEQGGVAYLAHVGGAVTGIVVALLFYADATYIKSRNAAAEGWSIYEGD